MKNFTILLLMISHCYGGQVILKDGRFIDFEVSRSNKGDVEGYQILLHDGGAELPVSIMKESAPIPRGDFVLRLPRLGDEISDYFEDDKEITLFIKTTDRSAHLFSVDLEAGEIARPSRSISFPRKHDYFADDSESWVLLDHDQLAFRSKGFAQRIFVASDNGVMEELVDIDTEKPSKRRSVQRVSTGGELDRKDGGALKYRGSEGESANQQKVNDRDRLPLIVAGGLLVVIFFLLFKMLKGKLYSC